VKPPKKPSWQYAALVATAAWSTYVAAFVPVYGMVGGVTAAVSLLPVALAAWMRGARAGVISAAVTIPVNGLLFRVVGEDRGPSGIVSGLVAASVFALVAWGVGYLRDANRRIVELTFHEPITGLPNRAAFLQEIGTFLTDGGAATLVLVGLDGLDDVNESFGFQVGDDIIREVARRLRFLGFKLVARLSDSAFGVVAAGTASDESLANTVLSVFETPFIPGGAVLRLVGHAGIARSAGPNDSASELLRRADGALHRASGSAARWASAIRKEGADRDHASRLHAVAALQSAMARGELLLHFQPVIGVSDRAARCFEALVRWGTPDGKLVPPSAFIPLAEQTGLIVPMTEWILDEAMRNCATWIAAGHETFVAVNISAKSFAPSAHLVEVIRTLLERHQLPASRLGIEITETDAMIDPRQTAQVLTALKELGIKTAVDDFGTGYSSLGYLNQLPLDAVKIDRSFVQRMLTDAGTATIVRAAIDLSHALGLETVAEGVEDDAMLKRLAHMGCDRAQGYLFAKPMAAGAVLPWLARHETTTAQRSDEEAVPPVPIASRMAAPSAPTILVVDDEHPLRVAAHRILSATGFNVLNAATASEAVRICAEYDGALDLVLSDVFLTDWGGNELADRLRETYPGLKVVLMSADPRAKILAKDTSLLVKPYTRAELVAHVRGALAA
jgi:diguanylate cyclase (GGDEF)-like protein